MKRLKRIIYWVFFSQIMKMNNHYSFSEKWPGIFLNPFYFARKALYRNIGDIGSRLNGKVLDVGCGSQPYKNKINHTEYVSLEYDTPENRASKKADFFYDGHHFPFPDNVFDSVLATQVFEHVFNPQAFMKELNRVLKPGGKLLLTVPFVWDEHEQPYDFARYSSFGIASILKTNGFRILEQRKTCNNITIVFQLWNDYLYKKIIGTGHPLRVTIINFLTSISNVAGLFWNLLLPSNDDLYLDNIVLAEKIEK